MLKKLNEAMDYIEAHLEDEFLLEKISEHINVSAGGAGNRCRL